MAAALERALGSAGPGTGPVPEVPEVSEPVLVLGPAGSGRTALLLQAALAGGAHGPRALFLAPSAVPRLPNGGGGTGTDPRALQRLELRYPRSRGSLCRELGALSLRPPDLLLLDGLEQYLGESPGGCARLAALLLETTHPPGPRGHPRPPPQVVAALRLPPPAPHVLPTLRRFFPARCLLSPRPGGLVGVRLSRPGRPPRRWRLRLDPHGEGEGGEEEQEEEEEEEEGGSDPEEEWG
ncbi:PREDICTED: ATPase SWSAP1 [Lepidothrix coronata]|uniref:ATPase SWSAP1 n=1 Tax=Lepidothrix coronata TaxID=321398 RepID=A0A6J0J964_9PASS|nr:PREDICTED: ATPase SWSAP1 [Lepidothrix coronata]